MLIYNYQKEFLGIDEGNLKDLGFSNLSELRSESADFADLFVKTPGFVHNFKHVHWIDFVTCAESSEDSKVIIHANGKNFKCTLDIKAAYLVDDPSQKAYFVHLVNLRELSHNENEQVAGDVLEKPAPRVSSGSSAIFTSPEPTNKFNANEQIAVKEETQEVEDAEEEITPDPYETGSTDTLDELDSNPNIVEDIYEDAPIDLGDDLLEIDETEDDFIESDELELEEEVKTTPVAPAQILDVGSDYVYDPHLASDELGLPVDLIEEFIQDFISQANEFKDRLYDSLNEGDSDNVKILSHKLKGVAANLRIEDAFEVLTTMNTSNDDAEIRTNMDTLYIIIEKLSGKAIQKTKTTESVQAEETFTDDDDDLILSFKDVEKSKPEPEAIEEIEMPELPEPEIDIQEPDEFKQEDFIEEPTIELNIPEEITLDNPPPLQYDKTIAADEIGLDTQNFDELFKDYIIESDKACSKINEEIEQNNSESWKKMAIKLKGMSDNMRIHDFTAELESIIHTQDSDIAKKAIDTINTKLQLISNREV